MLYIDITSIVFHHGGLKFDFFVQEAVAESWLLFEFDLKTCTVEAVSSKDFRSNGCTDVMHICNHGSCQQQGLQFHWMYIQM